MKLLTLNTHSLAEPDYEKKLHLFVDIIKKEHPHIFALQEVNQTKSESEVTADSSTGYKPCRGFHGSIRKDNHALRVAALLSESGCPYQWTWVPAKLGYSIYEEGLAVFSCWPIEETEQFFISKSQSFDNWKTRKIVGIQAKNQWFYSVHMGWWADEEEPFVRHWDEAAARLKKHRDEGRTVWVMGDFNSPCRREGEGYDYIKQSGWHDTYELAETKDSGITVGKAIDGWRESKDDGAGMRIDYIWCSRNIKVCKSEVICNDVNYPVVSDHYGVMAEVPE